jgi:hypothetical protein
MAAGKLCVRDQSRQCLFMDAYINYISTGKGPFYYNFRTYNEKNDYNAAVQLVNKLYPFRDMAAATDWIVPFPISM